MIDPIKINRVPALTLWAAIVAERLGFDRDGALTLVRAVAGLNAYFKGVRLSGGEGAAQEGEEGGRVSDRALGRGVPAVQTPKGIRALDKDKPASKIWATSLGPRGETLGVAGASSI